jgi:hypothetical protein
MQTRTRRSFLFAVGLGAMMTVLGSVDFAQSSNPFIGTWRLNVAKSKSSPGPAPRSSTTRIDAAGAGVKYTVDQVSATGAMLHWEFAGAYDGKDNKVTGDNPNGDTVALTRVDTTTVRQVNKLAGKITTTQIAVVSADGKTRTLTTTGTNLKGQVVNDVAVYEKQ